MKKQLLGICAALALAAFAPGCCHYAFTGDTFQTDKKPARKYRIESVMVSTDFGISDFGKYASKNNLVLPNPWSMPQVMMLRNSDKLIENITDMRSDVFTESPNAIAVTIRVNSNEMEEFSIAAYLLTLGIFPAHKEVYSKCDVTVCAPNIKNMTPTRVRTNMVSSFQLSIIGISYPLGFVARVNPDANVRSDFGIFAAPHLRKFPLFDLEDAFAQAVADAAVEAIVRMEQEMPKTPRPQK